MKTMSERTMRIANITVDTFIAVGVKIDNPTPKQDRTYKYSRTCPVCKDRLLTNVANKKYHDTCRRELRAKQAKERLQKSNIDR